MSWANAAVDSVDGSVLRWSYCFGTGLLAQLFDATRFVGIASFATQPTQPTQPTNYAAQSSICLTSSTTVEVECETADEDAGDRAAYTDSGRAAF